MSVEMTIKEGFSETRHSTSYGELKKSNEVTSFEAILMRNRFSNALLMIKEERRPSSFPLHHIEHHKQKGNLSTIN